MTSFWPLLVCTVILASFATASNVVPVMLWSSDLSTPQLVNPLQKTSKNEFENILSERLTKTQPPILLFVKDNFCVENIKSHQESLQRLSSAGPLSYYTGVEAALSVFENLLSYNVTKGEDVESIAEGQVVVLPVNDLSAIPDIYSTFRDDSLSPMIALTGKSCGYSTSAADRIKRAAATDGDTPIIVKDKRILFYADKITLKVDDGEVKELAVTANTVTTNESSYNLTLSGLDFSINAVFQIGGGYFILNGVYYTEQSGEEKYFRSQDSIAFPYAFSYHCGKNSDFFNREKLPTGTTIRRDLKIKNLQVQMDAEQFGDAYDCVGFTSIPIWTGIFVILIFALIMFWGVTMIMDIRTMDRFDDPKGKTITISAAD